MDRPCLLPSPFYHSIRNQDRLATHLQAAGGCLARVSGAAAAWQCSLIIRPLSPFSLSFLPLPLALSLLCPFNIDSARWMKFIEVEAAAAARETEVYVERRREQWQVVGLLLS